MKWMRAIILFVAVANISISFAKGNDEGFIYGKVITKRGNEYMGIIRWERQEFFWDDLFNANKTDNPWEKYLVRQDDDYKKSIKIFGGIVKVKLGTSHQFVTRFGDIKWIEPGNNGKTKLMMKNGSVYKVTGWGDIGATLQIYDQNLGKVKMDWDNIEKIEFSKTPKKVKKPGYRLYGKVETRHMDFEGWIMWDAEECISSDILDGEAQEGDFEIEFGNIHSIERRSSSSSIVVLKDGREFILRGTNDVNDENRGIYVEDKRYGKVTISWDDFEKVTYMERTGSGDPYEAYKPTGKLRGSVRIYREGDIYGEIIYDLDESEGFEILDGKIEGISFYIPFRQIKSIVPKGRYSCLVRLISNEDLLLEDTQDVTSNNDGILIITESGEKEYFKWDKVEKVIF